MRSFNEDWTSYEGGVQVFLRLMKLENGQTLTFTGTYYLINGARLKYLIHVFIRPFFRILHYNF